MKTILATLFLSTTTMLYGYSQKPESFTIKGAEG